MAVACTVMAVFFVLVSHLMTSTYSTAEHGTQASRIDARNQQLLDQMQSEVSAAVEIFQQDDIGMELFETLQKPEQAVPLEFTSLPRVLGGRVFGRELRSGARTGNALVFAKWERTKKIECGERSDEGGEQDHKDTTKYEIDVYRLICYYLVPVGDGLNLFRFVSEGLADATQIEAIELAEDQLEVMRKLVGDKVTGAWRRDVVAPPDWFVINPSRGTMDSVEFIAQDPQQAKFMLDPKVYAIASNDAGESIGVGEFGVKTSQQGGFPHGFEVQMMGPPSERELLLHLTLVSASSRAGSEVYSNLRRQFVQGR